MNTDPMTGYLEWIDQYGPTFRYSAYANAPRILTADPIAISHILGDIDAWIRPPMINKELKAVTGSGLIWAHGEAHRRQRKIMAPAFGPKMIQNLLPVFYDQAEELKNKISKMLDNTSVQASPTLVMTNDEEGKFVAREIDVHKYISEMTLDGIGKAAFDYNFGTLAGEETQLGTAFEQLSTASAGISAVSILQNILPGGSRIVSWSWLIE